MNDTKQAHTNPSDHWAAIFEFVQSVALVIFLSFVLRYWIFQPYTVEGASMTPNIHNNDYLWVDKVSYKVSSPQRGDIVVLKYPIDPTENFIKRIIGLPGERVVFNNGSVTIYNEQEPQGLTLEENYLNPNNRSGFRIDEQLDVTVPADQYFVLGDNRKASSDSRSWGYLSKENIVGRALVRLYPLSDLTFFIRPHYEN